MVCLRFVWLLTPLVLGIGTAAAQTTEQPQSGCDASCIRANMQRAIAACTPRIEGQSPTDFEWVTRPIPGIFQEAEPATAPNTVVIYRGDLVRFLSGSREWHRFTYECSFDVRLGTVSAVKARQGRINAPPVQPAKAQGSMAAVPSATGAPAAGQAPAVVDLTRVGEPDPVTIRQVPATR
jgi:hypothetical protein